MSFPPILDTTAEVIEKTRELRQDLKRLGPQVRAKDIALGIYDAYRFSVTLARLLKIAALKDIARNVIQEERARQRERESAAAGSREQAQGTAEFPGFDEICAECPNNYALPGDEPEDTVYVETFDVDYTLLVQGAEYLEKFADGARRNGAALRRLHVLCVRLGGIIGETPREILQRHGYRA